MRTYLQDQLTALHLSLAEQRELIFERRSADSFSDIELNGDEQEHILNFLDGCDLPFASQDLHIDWISEETLHNLFFNQSKKVVSCPQYLLFRLVPDDHSLYNLGAVIQQLALWLHARGYSGRLQSQFNTGLDSMDTASDYAIASEGQTTRFEEAQPLLLPLVMAIGTPDQDQKSRPAPVLMKRFVTGAQDKLDPIHYQLMTAALAAPTERRELPWHFVLEGRRIHLYMRQSLRLNKYQRLLMRKVGVGCLLANVMFSASLLQRELQITIRTQAEARRKMEYVCTLTPLK